jgi:hypothetical protein
MIDTIDNFSNDPGLEFYNLPADTPDAPKDTPPTSELKIKPGDPVVGYSLGNDHTRQAVDRDDNGPQEDKDTRKKRRGWAERDLTFE